MESTCQQPIRQFFYCKIQYRSIFSTFIFQRTAWQRYSSECIISPLSRSALSHIETYPKEKEFSCKVHRSSFFITYVNQNFLTVQIKKNTQKKTKVKPFSCMWIHIFKKFHSKKIHANTPWRENISFQCMWIIFSQGI